MLFGLRGVLAGNSGLELELVLADEFLHSESGSEQEHQGGDLQQERSDVEVVGQVLRTQPEGGQVRHCEDVRVTDTATACT